MYALSQHRNVLPACQAARATSLFCLTREYTFTGSALHCDVTRRFFSALPDLAQ